MAIVAVSGESGCRWEEVARHIAHQLGFTFVSDATLRHLLVDEFGAETAIPDPAYAAAALSILARLGRDSSLVLATPNAEAVVASIPSVLRVRVTAPERFRIGMLMLEHHLERAAALQLLHQLESEEKSLRRKRFGRLTPALESFDLIVNSEHLEVDQAAAVVETAARLRRLHDHGPLTVGQEAELQFQARLKLARHRITPAGRAALTAKPFVNESEAIFANLLDFYRIDWQYEPKTFPIQWDASGRATESFTPDFYLPEFDLYIELTTMKQANVTKKNRKIKLLKTIYPHVNIQVFYQKDFQNLVFKYGLTERVPAL